MNIPADDPDFDPFAHDLKKKKPGGGSIAWLALLVALSVAAFNGYQWWLERTDITETDSRNEEISALRQAHTGLQQNLEALRARQQAAEQRNDPSALAEVESIIGSVQARLSELELSEAGDAALLEAVQNAMASLHERQTGLDTSMAALARRGETPDKTMNLAEVDFLLRLAGERLQLFGDLRSADQALTLAQTYLAALEDPLYLAVQRRIEAARQSLAEVPELDAVATSGRITALQAGIPALPFPGELVESSGPAPAADAGVWQRIKSALTPLVKVRRRVDESSMLSLEDKDFLRQGLWLQLETARLALMRRDGSSWDTSLARAAETLQGRFDTNSQAVQTSMAAIGELQALPLAVELPDISAPWDQLRLLREGQAPGRGPGPAAVPGQAREAPVQQPAEPDGAENETEASPDDGGNGA